VDSRVQLPWFPVKAGQLASTTVSTLVYGNIKGSSSFLFKKKKNLNKKRKGKTNSTKAEPL
jgi:hypothetical protein